LRLALPSDPHRRATAITRGIVVVGAAILLAVWVVVISSIDAARTAAMDRARSEGHNLAAALEDQVAQILNGVDAATEVVAKRLRAERSGFDLYAWARDNPLLVGGIVNAIIIGPDGKLAASTVDRRPRPADFSDSPQFRVNLD